MTCWCGDDHTPECPTCGKCGAPVSTGAMALICPKREQCEFWTPEAGELLDLFDRPSASASGAQS